MITLEIVFDNPTLLTSFMRWLEESGEQYYFEENKEYGVTGFVYHYEHKRILTHGNVMEDKLLDAMGR